MYCVPDPEKAEKKTKALKEMAERKLKRKLKEKTKRKIKRDN